MMIREDVLAVACVVICLTCWAWICWSFYEFVYRPMRDGKE